MEFPAGLHRAGDADGGERPQGCAAAEGRVPPEGRRPGRGGRTQVRYARRAAVVGQLPRQGEDRQAVLTVWPSRI